MTSRLWSLAIAGILASSASAQPTAKDRIDQWLAPPRNAAIGGEPRPLRPISPVVLQPQLGLTNVDVLPSLVPLPPIKPYRPRNAQEPAPLLGWTGDRELPAPIKAPAATPVVQVNPQLETMAQFGQYVRDRASLADPTWEASMLLILDPKSPWRDAPLPFHPLNLPDPFEAANAVRLRSPWPETTELPRFVVPPTGR